MDASSATSRAGTITRRDEPETPPKGLRPWGGRVLGSRVVGRLTDTSGAFTFAGLAKGVYVLEARRNGCAPLCQRVLVGELSVFLDLGVLPHGRIESRYSLDGGMRRSVRRGRGEIVANATDLLNTMQLRRTIRGTDFRLVSTDYLETQVVRVGYTWKF